jgi:hypothetical protein
MPVSRNSTCSANSFPSFHGFAVKIDPIPQLQSDHTLVFMLLPYFLGSFNQCKHPVDLDNISDGHDNRTGVVISAMVEAIGVGAGKED